jgi:hypothetical protein
MKMAGEDLLLEGPCRCMIIDPNGMTLYPYPRRRIADPPHFMATCPPDIKQHVGKKGFAERTMPGEVRITLDDGTTLCGSECWWIKLEKGQ